MTSTEQTRHFHDEIVKVVERFAEEYDLSWAIMVGVMEILKTDLTLRCINDDEDDEEEEEDDQPEFQPQE